MSEPTGRLLFAYNTITELNKRIAEFEDLSQMIIDSESADTSMIPIMYHSWLHKAKELK